MSEVFMYLRYGLARLTTKGVINSPLGFYMASCHWNHHGDNKFKILTLKLSAPLTRL
jgi:hypothetical protein